MLGACVFGALFQDDILSAERYLNRLAPLVAHPDHLMRASFLFQQAWVHRIKGDLSRAWTVIQEGFAVKGLKGSPFPEALFIHAAADLLHALGRTIEAQQYLNRLEKIAEDMESLHFQFIAQVLKATFALERGKQVETRAILQQALAVGNQGGFTFFYWWMPDMIARLCEQALEAKIEVDYVQKLIRTTKLIPVGQVSTNEAWPWPIKIYTLGRFEIHLDGKPLPPRRKAPYRVLNLLKAMVAMGGHDIPTSRLIDALWPDTEGDIGQETFNKTLQRLRHLLVQEQVVQVRDGKASLNPSLCWVDALVVEKLLSSDGMDNGRPMSDTAWVSPWERATALYRGQFLGDDDGVGWAELRRGRLHDRVVEAGQRLIDHWNHKGDAIKAQEVRRWIHTVTPESYDSRSLRKGSRHVPEESSTELP